MTGTAERKIKTAPTADEAEGLETEVARHYARTDLEGVILDALASSGKDVDALVLDDLAPVDEFHTGGRQATVELAAQAGFAPGSHLLDIGCGIGGPARFLAATLDCRVTGIDLTEDYVRAAEALARRVGLSARVNFRQASALALPFDPATFDGAYMMHVGMNIENKPTLFREARRVLKDGGVFAIYDAMRMASGELKFPVHWAATPQTSFVVSAADYHRMLEAAGFEIIAERNRGEFARRFFRQVAARMAESGTPPLGIHILMQRDVPQKLANVVAGLESGLIAPVELICRAR